MVHNATVVLEVEKPPELDMKEILDKVKAQYEAMANRAREDAEQVNQQKVSILSILLKITLEFISDHFSPTIAFN